MDAIELLAKFRGIYNTNVSQNIRKHDLEVDEELIGEINISSLIQSILNKQNHIGNTSDTKLRDTNHENDIFHLNINANFDIIKIESFISQVNIFSKNLQDNEFGQEIKLPIIGNLIYFGDNSNVRYSYKKIEIDNLIVKKINIRSNVSNFRVENIVCEEFELNGYSINDKNFVDIDSLVLNGSFKKITLFYIISKSVTIINSREKNFQSNVIISENKIENLVIYSLNISEINIRIGNYDNVSLTIPGDSRSIELANFSSKSISILRNIDESEYNIDKIKINSIRNLEKLAIEGLGINDKIKFLVNILELRNLDLQTNFTGHIGNICDLQSLSIEGVNNRGEFTFKNIYFQTNSKSSINNKVRFEIKDTLLNNTKFINCKFPNIINVQEIDLSKITLINTVFPNKIRSLNDGFKNDKISTYQQIKKIYENKGDKETAGMYRSRELNSRLWKLLFNKRFIYNIEEIFNLIVNSFSNNHGQSWSLTILSTFLYGVLFYGFFLYSIGYNILITGEGFRNYCDYISHIFQFLIPGFIYPGKSKFDDLLGFFRIGNFASLSGWSQFWILFNDIVAMPYLIYQFISAFRRHGGK